MIVNTKKDWFLLVALFISSCTLLCALGYVGGISENWLEQLAHCQGVLSDYRDGFAGPAFRTTITKLPFEEYEEEVNKLFLPEEVIDTTYITEITPEIQELADSLRAEDVMLTIKNIDMWVNSNIEYWENCQNDVYPYWVTAHDVLGRGFGCCHHKTLLAISLLRANGIYAGYLYERKPEWKDHAQALAVIPCCGEPKYILLGGPASVKFDGTFNETVFLIVS